MPPTPEPWSAWTRCARRAMRARPAPRRRRRPDALGLGLGGGAAPGELDGVVPAVGARVVLGQRIAALAAHAAEREALLPALAGSGVGSGALHRASLGAHGNPRSSAGQAPPARPPWRRPQSLPPRSGRRKAASTEPPGQR